VHRGGPSVAIGAFAPRRAVEMRIDPDTADGHRPRGGLLRPQPIFAAWI